MLIAISHFSYSMTLQCHRYSIAASQPRLGESLHKERRNTLAFKMPSTILLQSYSDTLVGCLADSVTSTGLVT